MAPAVAGMLAVVLVAAAGCSQENEQHPRAAAEARVGRRLYAENLLADPEVGARVRAAVHAIEREEVPADSALTALDAWLGEWVARHPERAARARMLPHARRAAPGEDARGGASRERDGAGRP